MCEHYQSGSRSRDMGANDGRDVGLTLRAFQVDPGWYEAYWYSRSEIPPSRGRVRVLLDYCRKLVAGGIGWLASAIATSRPERPRLGRSEGSRRQVELRPGAA